MITRLAQLIDTVPTHLRLNRVARGEASATRSDIGFVDVGDAIVRFRRAGSNGPSLVLATDPPVPLELYDQLIALLASDFRVTVFEIPGFGCSLPRVGFRFSLPRAAASVTRFLEQLPAAPHVLAMPCVSGYVAVAIANARPELVSRLILAQTPSWADGQSWLRGRDRHGLLRRPVIGQLALAALRRKRARAWYQAALGTPSLLDAFTAATLHNFDQGGCFCLASGFQDFLRDHHGLLKPVKQQALILWGRADASHRHSEPKGAASFAPNAQLACLDGVGHFPELEAPAAVLTQIRSFVDKGTAR